jgi:3-dehydroquinate synthase
MTLYRNVVLTGFMGSGKTTVGRLLAARCDAPFLDTDELIAQRAGKPITAIFADDGADAFRDMEAALTQELAVYDGAVIATGGRLMLDSRNAALAADNLVVCLRATPETILARVRRQGEQRPLLAVKDPTARVRALLAERAEGYARFPQVDVDGHTAGEIASLIGERFDLARRFAPGARADAPLPQTIAVNYPGGRYNVVVGANLLADWRDLTGAGSRPAIVISDHHVAPFYAQRLGDVLDVVTIPAGEEHKTLATVHRLYERLLVAGLDRAGLVLALGGGVTGDVAGFVAATYMRGVPVIQCPTSLLAMVDASVGGKTGVDLPQGKNLVGAFKQPEAVLADISTLRTLPPAELAAGMAEVVKHGIISDPALLAALETEPWQGGADPRVTRELADLQPLLVAAIAVKRDVVEEDPFEEGRRAVLNLGHTFGHAVERVSGYAVRHGEAVAMGVVVALRLSQALAYCDAQLPRRIEALLRRLHLPTRLPAAWMPEEILAATGSDKKRAAGRQRYVLVRDVGDVFVSADVPEAAVLATLQALTATQDTPE